MERKIGEIFEHNGEWYQCIIGHCNQCCFDEAGTCKFIGDPYCAYRNDKKLACFKKLEKIGEPFYRRWTLEGNNKLMQRYKTYTTPLITIDKQQIFYNLTDDLLEIEIKQNKEDMEEKKIKISKEDSDYLLDKLCYILDERVCGEGSDEVITDIKKLLDIDSEDIESNLKPFNLEAAKAGKPVCTRNGRKARIICFDKRGEQPIVALIENKEESIDIFFNNGHSVSKTNEVAGDLMMLPEKKEGWVNVDKRSNGDVIISKPYPTRDEAIHNSTELTIDTVNIEWEE